MDARTLTALQDVVANMDVDINCGEQFSSSPTTPMHSRRRLVPVRSMDHVKRMILRIAILAALAAEAFITNNGNVLTGRGARDDFTRLIGTLEGAFMLMNYRTHKVI